MGTSRWGLTLHVAIRSLLASKNLTGSQILHTLLAMSPEENLKRLGIDLPLPPKAVANYVTWVRAGNLLFTSGHIPPPGEGPRPASKAGGNLSVDEGYQIARRTALSILATVRSALGSLDRVERVVKIAGMVNAVPEFADHPKVLNGCSDLFAEIFGESGRAARSAFGAGSLPGGAALEIEAIFEVR